LSDPINRVDPSGERVVDCADALAEYRRLKRKLEKCMEENVCSPNGPDAGHDKAIEQLRNAVERAREKALRHCKDPRTLLEAGILSIVVGTLFVPGLAGSGFVGFAQ
jgi:hypothetical protein